MPLTLISDRESLAQILLTDECFSLDYSFLKSLMIDNKLIFKENESVHWQMITKCNTLTSKYRLENGIKQSKGVVASDTLFFNGILRTKSWYLNGQLLGHPFGQARHYQQERASHLHCVTYSHSPNRVFNIDYLMFNIEGKLIRGSCILNGRYITTSFQKENELSSICPALKDLTLKDSFNILEAIPLSFFDLVEMQYS